MRIPLFVANWKMHKTGHDAVVFVRELSAAVRTVTGIEIVVAPSFTAIAAAAEAARSTVIGVAAQDVYFEREGAFTGEVSSSMIKHAGATYVIVGHSERRQLFGETDASVNRKARIAVEHDVTPIVCIGETLEERDAGETLTVLDRQIKAGLAGFGDELLATIVIAYEPVWAIGTGRNATPEQAQAVHAFLRKKVPAATLILYGGSVKPQNAAAIFAMPDVDGGLIGGASLVAKDFLAIAEAMNA
jgi:triosephosphate isomerase